MAVLGPVLCSAGEVGAHETGLPRIRPAADGRGFVTSEGRPFVPLGVNYFRPGTGWPPQVWRRFDEEAIHRDLARLRELGANCVRVFLSFGSFYRVPGRLSEEGLGKFDRFLALAEEVGLYVHPTGPDHWESLPEWARGDRIGGEQLLTALEAFWRGFAARYRGRSVIWAYDLLNEPEVGWDTPPMRERWGAWLRAAYGDLSRVREAWGTPDGPRRWEEVHVPARDASPGRLLLDYQRCREEVAVEWTRRQVAAIKSADPEALVTVGLIQWSVPVCVAGAWHYSGFRPAKIAPFLDFLEVHFYPLADGFYEYGGLREERRNLAYLELVVREMARPGKPVVLAEFGWYGGGQPSIDGRRHAWAGEAQQARWCKLVMEQTAGPVCGWLNWGLYDHPEAGDVTQFTGLFTADGRDKEWAREFRRLAARWGSGLPLPGAPLRNGVPALDWDRLVTDASAREEVFRRWVVEWSSGPGRIIPGP